MNIQRYGFPLIITIVFVGSIGLIWWAKTQQDTPTPRNAREIVSTNGLHAHPQLRIFDGDVEIEIPHNIGIGTVHQPMHTHDDVPVIHLEYSGVVTHDDLRLGKFFKVWGKDFHELGSAVTMTVNGTPNAEFANYEMKDGDLIELRYE